MTWLNSLKSLITSGLQTPAVPQESVYSEPTYFVRGKWVVCGEFVGIVTDLTTSGVIGIDLCNSQGEHAGHARVPASGVMLAKFEQIPESRRPFSREYATQLGYN